MNTNQKDQKTEDQKPKEISRGEAMEMVENLELDARRFKALWEIQDYKTKLGLLQPNVKKEG